MKRIAWLALTLLVFSISATPHAGEKQKPLRVLFISGSAEYESDKTLPILKKYFEAKHPSECTLISAKSQKDLPGLENLDKCDVAVLFTRRLELQGEQLDRIKPGRPWKLERRDRIVCEHGVWVYKHCWKCNGDANGNDRRTLQS